MSTRSLRIVTIALFTAAATFTAFAGDEGGPLLAASVACFSVGLHDVLPVAARAPR